MKKGPVIGNAVILLFFIIMLVNSFKLHEIRRFGEMGSGFWPILVLGLAVVLSAILFLSSLSKKGAKAKKEDQEPAAPESPAERGRARRVVFAASAATLAYIFAMQWLGFGVATLFYVLAFTVILGERRRWVLILSPVLVTVFILIVFSKFISIPFPRGVGVFADLSRILF
ncbi:MAG TPA: tripartite tricarboxylate transporter TctB family protein [Thermodesulfobacteriota bacterium]|nr:tripartite tricarboxylate transporter TctB family protein [Thermodesulfobacteriota bacterium]